MVGKLNLRNGASKNTTHKMENFTFIRDMHTRNMIENGYQAVSQLELWSWLRNYEPEDGHGFMFSSSPNLDRITQQMESLPNSVGHSGSSFGYTMRNLHFIAKHGIDAYKNEIQSHH